MSLLDSFDIFIPVISVFCWLRSLVIILCHIFLKGWHRYFRDFPLFSFLCEDWINKIFQTKVSFFAFFGNLKEIPFPPLHVTKTIFAIFLLRAALLARVYVFLFVTVIVFISALLVGTELLILAYVKRFSIKLSVSWSNEQRPLNKSCFRVGWPYTLE